jgi:hypothetical protein
VAEVELQQWPEQEKGVKNSAGLRIRLQEILVSMHSKTAMEASDKPDDIPRTAPFAQPTLPWFVDRVVVCLATRCSQRHVTTMPE